MKSINIKRLLLTSSISIFLGASLLVAAAKKRQYATEDIEQVLFTYRVLGRGGILLIIFGVLVAVLAVGRVIARHTKRLLVSSVALLVLGDLLIWHGQHKLTAIYAARPPYDGNAIDYYRYTLLPIAIFTFALGVIGFSMSVWRFFFNGHKLSKLYIDEEHNS